MRTTIDMPEDLYGRARRRCAEHGTTLRALIIAGLERELADQELPQGFRLRDAAAGYAAANADASAADQRQGVDSAAINAAIDQGREQPFQS